MSEEKLVLRRLFSAPDAPCEMVASTASRGLPHLRYDKIGRTICVVPDNQAPRVSLPFPAIDVSWCPEKKGKEYASFLTASTSQPLQMWDVEDADLRASYVAENDSGLHASPRCSLWLSGRGGSLIAGGYGGFEDKTKVRFFDVLLDGKSSTFGYRSRYEKGSVCAMANGPSDLVLAGFSGTGSIDAIDTRVRAAALLLQGVKGGISGIVCHPTESHLVYAGGRLGENRIVCWDVRKCLQPLTQFQRDVRTHQVCDMVFVEDPLQQHGYALVSATTSGGIITYSNPTLGSETIVHGTTRHTSLGVTSGMAALPGGYVAAVVGTRDFSFHGRKIPEPQAISTKSVHKAAMVDEEGEGEEAAGTLLTLGRKRPYAAMEASDDDENDNSNNNNVTATTAQYTESSPNVAVVSALQ